MVNKTDATRIAVDATTALAAQAALFGPGKGYRHLGVEYVMNSTIWHYALRDSVNGALGADPKAILGAKGLAHLGLYLAQQWADGSPVRLAQALTYAAASTAAELGERAVGV